MEFSAMKEDHNVAEFYDNFGHTLPMIVKVNQGFCGEIVEDTFDREEIVRLHTVSRQKRVVAKAEQGNHVKLYSIPLNYQSNLCVVSKKGKDGKEKPLAQIMKEHALPVTVRFPRDSSISIGSQTVSTNHIPAMELTQEFDEMYLLGNFIVDGVLSHQVIHVPLYLSQLRLSIVTGIKGKPKEKWNSYVEELTSLCDRITYDPEFGNTDIAVYNQNAMHADTLYSFIEPAQYANILSVFPILHGEYEALRKPPDETEQSTNMSPHVTSFKPTDAGVPDRRNTLKRSNKEQESPPRVSEKPADSSKARPPVAPKPHPNPLQTVPSTVTTPVIPKKPFSRTDSNDAKYAPQLPARNQRAKAIAQVEETWEFITEKEDYNVAEFYEHFGEYLPKVTMINQGFYGEIVEETFDRGQILRFNAVSRQPRVVAKTVLANQTKLYSIPLAYQAKLCVIGKHGKVEAEQPLYDIIKSHDLPISVRFPRDNTITIGSQTISTNHVPDMELTQTFDEMYLLGNFIVDGVMAEDVVNVPLYLSQLRFSIVTGVKNRDWEMYLKDLEHASACSEYDLEFGNSEIAVYQHGAMQTDVEYAYLEPTAYANMFDIFKRGAVDNPTYSKSNIDDADTVYEVIERPSDTVREASTFADRLSHAIGKQKKKIIPPNAKSSPNVQPKSDKHKIPPPPEIKIKYDQAPQIPERNLTQTNTHSQDRFDPPNHYANELPRGQATPRMRVPHGNQTEHSQSTEKEPEHPFTQSSADDNQSDHFKLPTLLNGDDVAKLTIHEVSEYLKRLNLGEYADQFKEQMVDGITLQEYDKDILKEFGLKGTESIRLLKFAKDGHVPK